MKYHPTLIGYVRSEFKLFYGDVCEQFADTKEFPTLNNFWWCCVGVFLLTLGSPVVLFITGSEWFRIRKPEADVFIDQL